MSELKNPERELYLFRRRLALAGGIVVLAFMVLLGRFIFSVTQINANNAQNQQGAAAEGGAAASPR